MVAHHPAVAAVATAAPVAAPAASLAVAVAGAEVAPLAGVVVSIDVALGQTIEAGDKIATIEAMKMKTDVYAKGAGRVASIAVRARRVRGHRRRPFHAASEEPPP